MIYVVLDTNVLVSALWSKDGTPSKIAHLIPDKKIIPCYCDDILNEYNIVLSRPKFGFQKEQITALLVNIKKYGKAIVADKSTLPLPDESDRVFYDVARASEAILITGNIKHFPPEPFIMTPSEFLMMLPNNPLGRLQQNKQV